MNERRHPRPAPAVDERGLTLVEVVISVLLLALIAGALSAAFVTSLNISRPTSQRLKESNDSQLIAAFLVRDAQAAGGTDPLTGIYDDSSLGVSTSDVSIDGMACTNTTNLLLSFKWIDQTDFARHVAVYSYAAGSHKLLRTTCSGTSSSLGTPQPLVLGKFITPTPVVTCFPSVCSTLLTPTTMPDKVRLDLTETNNPKTGSSPYSYSLTASLRSQRQTAPSQQNSAAVPLLLLGSGSCASGATAVNVNASATMRVYGNGVINTTDGSTCSAMSVTNGGIYTAGSTSFLSGGHCTTDRSGSVCPPSNTYGPPALTDPYLGLVPPPPGPAQSNTCASGSSGTLSPGVYSTLVTVKSDTVCTLQHGVYTFQAGLTVSNGGSITSAAGGVLLYISGGAFQVSGSASVTLSAQASGPYTGLVIWEPSPNNNPITFGAGGSLTLLGTIYAPTAQVKMTGDAQNPVVSGIVAQSITILNSTGITIGTPSPTPLSITGPGSLQSWLVNSAYPNTTVQGAGGDGKLIWSAAGLPGTITINASTGLISGSTGATPGSYAVTVNLNDVLGDNPATKNYTLVVNAAPTVTSTNPASRGQGAQNQNITINGTGFVNGANSAFSGPGITVNSTTWVSATKLTANINIDPSAATGARNVTVTNPDNGNGTGVGVFTVTAKPTVTSTNPASRGQGAQNQNITVNGTGFVNAAGLVASFSGSGIHVITTTWVSATKVTANVNIDPNAATGVGNVSVTNPDGGVGIGVGVFTVNAAPTLTSLINNASVKGAANVTVTVNGTGFVSGATVSFTVAVGDTGTAGDVTVNSVVFNTANKLTIVLTVANRNAAKGTYHAVVANPDGGPSPTGAGNLFTVS